MSFQFSVVSFQLVGIGAEWRGLVAFLWSDLHGATVREGMAPNAQFQMKNAKCKMANGEENRGERRGRRGILG